eukprot:5304466-Prymnesium_polylepis.1
MDAAARKTHPWWYRRLFKSGLEGPDPAQYPIASANEASKTFPANTAYIRVQLTVDDIQGAIPADQADGEWLGLA